MAGDWIKMRSDLLTHPKIVRMMSALKADKLRVIGGLHAVWCLFDMHSEDGQLDGYSPEVLDDYLNWQGFSTAMISIDWLQSNGESLIAPRFDEHNGQSAKRRAQESSRKKEARKTSADDADKSRTKSGPEKRREEKNINHSLGASGFNEFWSAYPKKTGKAEALKSWKKAKPELCAVLAALSWQTKSLGWTKDGGQFVPNPATYLNQGRWQDEPTGGAVAVSSEGGMDAFMRKIGAKP